MELSLNHYRKFLIDEIMVSSHATLQHSIEAVDEFSTTSNFMDSYHKWVELNKKNTRRSYGVRSIKEILDLSG